MLETQPPEHLPQLALSFDEAPSLDRHLQFIAGMLVSIANNLPQQRRQLAESTRAIHLRVVLERRSGWCPCCHTVRIVSASGDKLPDAEFDHFLSRSQAASSETWLICRWCNAALRTAEGKLAARSNFESYQQALEAIVTRAQRELFS